MIISGLGFSGWSDSSPPKPKWDRAKNVDILGVEFAKSAVQLPLVWNIQVSTWLRHCELNYLLDLVYYVVEVKLAYGLLLTHI